MSDFVHLHNHTHYSILDALTTVDDLVTAAVNDGHKAVALTDHGVMYATIDFYNTCRYKGIKPLIGFEAYVANGSRFDKGQQKNTLGKKKKNYYHIILLAKDQTGYKNLLKLTSLGHTEGFYYRPRIDKELLEKHREGIIATSACLGGVVSSHLADGDYESAKAEAQYYKDLYGDDFYLEIQNHGLEKDPIILRDVPKIGQELGIKVIATNDIHYLTKNQAYAHNVHLSIRDFNSNNLPDIKDLRYGTPEYYFKTADEMKKLFADNPDSITNTLEIADKCDLELDLKTLYMPEFPIPKESKSENLDEYLRELVYKGLDKRYDVITPEIKERADYELDVIINMKFPGYFLIVWDFIRAARERGVSVGPGRGSAAGSLVAYALGITNVDPLPYDLLFERFLNPERISMPDIDIDFSDDKRDRIIQYVKEKYGENAVSQIITFGKLSSRSVLADVGRVLGIELSTIREITSKIQVVQGKVTPIAKALETPDLKWVKESSDPRIKDLIEYSLALENKIRNVGIHAAGVVIAPGEISDYAPVYQPSKSKDEDAGVVTQFSMAELELSGLVKMDFLGLRTLSIIENSLNMIKDNHGLEIDIDAIDFLDKRTWDLLGEGNTLAVFQFESAGMAEYLKQLKPQNLEELTAMNALYRPGPMENIPMFIDRKFGREPIQYLHPIMEKSLNTTYGIIVYQEQVMLLVQHIADFTLGEADILRRAMGKKKVKEMEKIMPKFVEGAAKKGISEELATTIFDLIYKFANYGFNKSHSLAYSYLAYQTAWLKANYMAEFLAANMTAELNDQDKIVALIDEAKKFDIVLLPPDINKSNTYFIAKGNSIFFGMAGIKNVGVPAVENIVKCRESGPFISFFDFIARVDNRLINRRTLEALICSGAFDSLNCGHRAALFEAIDSGIDYAKALNGDKNSDMDSLFGSGVESKPAEPRIPEVPKWSEKTRLEKEKSYMNFYVSGHPLNRFEVVLKSLTTLNLSDNQPENVGSVVRVGGLITEVRTRLDKKDRTIAFVQIEDFTGKGELIFWNSTYEKIKSKLVVDNCVIAIGKSDLNGDVIKVIVDELYLPDEASATFAAGLKMWLDLRKITVDHIRKLYDLLVFDDAPRKKMQFYLKDESTDLRKNYLAFDINLRINEETISQAMEILGGSGIRFIVN